MARPLSKRLNEVEVTEEVKVMDGVLQGLLPEKLEFEFKITSEDSITLRGDVADDRKRCHDNSSVNVAASVLAGSGRRC